MCGMNGRWEKLVSQSEEEFCGWVGIKRGGE